MTRLTFISMLGLLATAACAAPLAYEPFNYPAGQLLGFSTTTGQTNAAGQYWYNGTGAFSDATIVSGNLTYPGLATSSGNSFTNGGGGPGNQGNRFKFNTSISNDTAYASFLMRIDNLGTIFSGAPFTNAFVTALCNENVPGTLQQRCGLWVGTNGVDQTSFRLGSAQQSNGQNLVQWATNGAGVTIYFPVGQTLLIVQSYTFNTGSDGNDVSQIWVNPDASTFGSAVAPPSSATATPTGTDIFYIDRFNFRQNTIGNTPDAMTFDEFRFGTNWADVTPPPPLRIISIAGAGTTSVTVTWTNVLVGTNYVLQFNTNLSTVNWSDLAPVTATGSTASQTDNPPGGDTARFYRVLRQ